MGRIWRVALGATLAALALSGLAACEGRDAAQAQPPAAEASPVQPPTTRASPTEPPPAKSAPALALEGEGLRLVDPESGRTRPLAFGASQAEALTAIALAQGAPKDSGRNSDCGEGALDYAVFPGLTAWFQGGRFVGWSGVTGLTTMSGIGKGSTRQALDGAYAATVSQTSLGEEFSAGGLSGVLDGAGPSAKIAEMWAGMACLAR